MQRKEYVSSRCYHPVVVLLLACFLAQNAHAATIITFDPPGAVKTSPVSINTAGDITGWYDDGTAVHGFVRLSSGSIISFDGPKAVARPGTRPASINAAGQITGWYSDDGSTDHGFLRAGDGTVTTFDAPNNAPYPYTGTFPTAINDSGSVTGSFNSYNYHIPGFLRTPDGAFTEFEGMPSSINSNGTLAGWNGNDDPAGWIRASDGTVTNFSFNRPLKNEMLVTGINDSGVVVGYNYGVYCYPEIGCLYLKDEGALRTPDGTVKFFQVSNNSTLVAGINVSGQIAGYYISGIAHGFLRNPNGAVATFDVSGYWTVVSALNANGIVTGTYTTPDGNVHGFLRMP